MTAPNTGWCNLCPGPVPTPDLLGHLVVHHSDKYEPPETWPDGQVVVEEPLEPWEFGVPGDRP